MKKILQVNFKFKVPRTEYEKAMLDAAPKFGPNGDVKGLLWKIWIINETEKSAGGIYLFEDDATCKICAETVQTMLKSNPAVSDVEAKVFDILPEHTKITRGPV